MTASCAGRAGKPFIALAALVLLATTACGGKATPSTEHETNPANDPTPASSSPSTSSASIEANHLLTTLAANMDAKGSAHMTKRTPDESISGEFNADGNGTDYSMALSLPAARIEGLQFREVRGIDYISLPQVTGAGKFAKIDPNSTSLGTLISSMQSLRPGSSFVKVAPAVESVQDLGPSTIGADQTEHYLLLINSAKSHSLLNPGVKVPDSITSRLPRLFRYNLYVTKDMLLRRIQYEVLGKTTTMNFTGWGSRVQISAPPASAIVATPAGF